MGENSFKRLKLMESALEAGRNVLSKEEKYWYCWMLGTKPTEQRKGYAKVLASYTYEVAQKDSLPCVLETSSEKARTVHQGNGFKLLGEKDMEGHTIKLYFMIRR